MKIRIGLGFAVAACGAALLFTSPIAAQEERAGADLMCLPLGEALTRAAARDPAVAAAQAERDLAQADLKEARSLYRPQLSAFGRTGLGDVGLVDSVIQNQVGLRASQRIFDFGDSYYAREAARQNVGAGESAIMEQKLQSAFETGLAYIDSLDAKERLRITEERNAYFERQLAAVEAVLPAGGATRSERANVAAELEDSRAFAFELGFLKDAAETRLAVETGSEAVPCAAPEAAQFLIERMTEIPTAEEAAALALVASPVLDSLEKRAAGFEAARKREARSRLPVISVVGIAAYSSTGPNSDFTVQERVGVDVSVPLYSGSALSARNDRAAAQGALARTRLREAKRDIERDVLVIFQRIASLSAQLRSRQAAEAEARKQFEAASIEYDRGVRTLPDLTEVRLIFEAAALRRVAAAYDLMRQQLELLTLTAVLMPAGP